MATVIWNEKKQKWSLRVYIDGQYKEFSCKTKGITGKKTVLKKYRDYIEKGSVMSSKSTVRIVWSKFLDDSIERLGEHSESVRQYEKIGRLYILPAIGGKKIATLRKSDYQDILNNAKPHNKNTDVLSKKYMDNIRCTIKVFLNYAVENGYCEEIKGTLFVPKGHPTKGKKILQPNEIKELFKQSELHYHKAICFMLCTGLRPSECLGIQWKDIKQDVLTIRRGITTSGEISEGKNKNAKRVIPLAGITKQLLALQREQTQHLKSEWVFCDMVGGVGNQHTLANQLTALGNERGFSVSPYELRHTFVSLMANTMPEQMIKSIVGHSATMDTFGVYGHLVNGDMKQAADIIELRLGDIKSNTSEN